MARSQPVSYAQHDMVSWAMTEAGERPDSNRGASAKQCAEHAYEWCVLRAHALQPDEREAQMAACLAYIERLYRAQPVGSPLGLIAWFLLRQIAWALIKLILGELLKDQQSIQAWQHYSEPLRSSSRQLRSS